MGLKLPLWTSGKLAAASWLCFQQDGDNQRGVIAHTERVLFNQHVVLFVHRAFRYITALTDSEEEELSDAQESDEEEPADQLSVLLEKIDCLHKGSDKEKRESLDLLLEHREEVCFLSADI